MRDRASQSLRRSPTAMVVLSSFGIAKLLTGSTRPVSLVASPAAACGPAWLSVDGE